jgi:hypothetical protein
VTSYAALEPDEKLNIYFELADDFHGLDCGALWQDDEGRRLGWPEAPILLAAEALVIDKHWVRHGASAFGWLAPGELRLHRQR